MPTTRANTDDVRECIAVDFNNWLGDYAVLRTLVQRIVQQRLGRGHATVEMVLGESYSALKKIREQFEKGEEDADTDDEDGQGERRERMEEQAASCVLRWLGAIKHVPSILEALTSTERKAVGMTPAELNGLDFKTAGKIPVVPWVSRQEKRVRVKGEDEDEGMEYGESDYGETADDPPVAKRARRAGIGGEGTRAGPEAVSKCDRCTSKDLVCHVQVARRGTSACAECHTAKVGCSGVVATERTRLDREVGKSEVVREIRRFKADVVTALFNLAVIQVDPTGVTGVNALQELREASNQASAEVAELDVDEEEEEEITAIMMGVEYFVNNQNSTIDVSRCFERSLSGVGNSAYGVTLPFILCN
ncbi:hypothetical protein GGX14DRAFT_633044 [Mycena pura]|uniref:Zn(2)-C6 fungal-type domain-containing protein n=1 Tax=Mycena pura TaxID=153505 RepID=A0AAD6VCI8_9AGAR|nr:hypothetical protein GGX14DRAFT_633044 [Mycena pura]